MDIFYEYLLKLFLFRMKYNKSNNSCLIYNVTVDLSKRITISPILSNFDSGHYLHLHRIELV